MLHDLVLVVGGEGVVTCETDHRGHTIVVVVAAAGVATASSVAAMQWSECEIFPCQYSRPVVLSGVSEELDVSVGQLRDGSHASASATAVEGVGGTSSHLLGRQDGHVTFNNSSQCNYRR